MGNNSSELGPVPLHFDERSAKLGLFSALRERFLQQSAESVLLALNSEDVLNLLPSTRARNLGIQEHASHDLVPREAACARELLKVRHVRIGQAHRNSMLEVPHSASISITIALSREMIAVARANKPKALSAPVTAELGTKTRSEDAAVLVSAKTMPCPPVASHKLTLVVPGEAQPVTFGHKRDTFWRKRQEVTASVARAPTSVAFAPTSVARVTTSAARATSSARSRQRPSGRES